MIIVLSFLAVFALCFGAGYLFGLSAPPPRPRIPRVRYLGWSGSMWRERR